MKILIVGDTHFPFHDQKAVRRMTEFAAATKPEVIVQVGDLYDYYGFSRYTRSHRMMESDRELELGLVHATLMWKDLRRASKKSRCIQMLGNHDERAVKRAQESLPDIAFFVEDFTRNRAIFDGVELHQEYEMMLNGICFMHGHRSKLGDHARYNQMSTVVGHSHTGGVVFMNNAIGPFWELNAGWLGDKDSGAFSYRLQKRISTTTTGIGFIDDCGPRFIPL